MLAGAADPERILLRPACADDAPALHAYWSLTTSQRYTDRAVTHLEETRAHLAQRLEDPQALTHVIEHHGQVVGDIGGSFRAPHVLGGATEIRDFALGYTVAPDCWGRGIATTAVARFTAMLHDEFEVRRIVAMVFAENTASLRVLERNDYRLEGTERAAVIGRDGRWLDDCTLAHLPGDGPGPRTPPGERTSPAHRSVRGSSKR